MLACWTKQVYLSFLKDIHTLPDCPEHHGYNAEMIHGCGQSVKPKTCVSYMPQIDMPPANYDSICMGKKIKNH